MPFWKKNSQPAQQPPPQQPINVPPPSYAQSQQQQQQPPQQSQQQQQQPAMPKKFVMIQGIMKLNPDWTAARQRQPAAQSSGVVQPNALPVVCSMDQYAEMNAECARNNRPERPLSESTAATVEMMQEADIKRQAGYTGSREMVDALGVVFAKYEVPMGLMNRLFGLPERFDMMEFLLDDSGSMKLDSDTVDPKTNRVQSRWSEMRQRLKQMLELLAYVPTPPLLIRFLNRQTLIELRHSPDQTPEQFFADACCQVDSAFDAYGGPGGSTPMLQAMERSLYQQQRRRVALYVFCDGQPDGGLTSQQRICELCNRRPQPSDNPITFISCSNVDSEVEWMKDAEERGPYMSEFDDYADEATEVLGDQGVVLPYSRGMHLLCQLVAAMYPDDLDMMDESVPLTKFTLDSILGVQSDESDYRRYWDAFLVAQQKKQQQQMVWNQHYQQFLTQQSSANQFAVVQEYRRRMT